MAAICTLKIMYFEKFQIRKKEGKNVFDLAEKTSFGNMKKELELYKKK